MGPLHPLEYFAESIMNPSSVASAQDRDADGKSTMPSYNEKMTVQELIDVSAYLASLKPPATAKFVKGTGKIIAVVPQSKGNRTAAIFARWPTLRFERRSLRAGDDFAVSEWTARATHPDDGRRLEWDGVDVFPITGDGRIARKDVYSTSGTPRVLVA